MSRYIDADKLAERIKASPAFSNMGTDGEFLKDVTLDIIKNFPKADPFDYAVAIVRCKDCKHGTLCYGEIKCTVDEEDCGFILYHEPQHFCSYGERREE